MPILANPNRNSMKGFEHYLLPCKLSALVILPARFVHFRGRSSPDRRPNEVCIRARTDRVNDIYGLHNDGWDVAKMTQAFRKAYSDILLIGPSDDPEWGAACLELIDHDDGVLACVSSNNSISSRMLCRLLPEAP